jgi:two-component system, NarL family, sensor histidine kinase DevS
MSVGSEPLIGRLLGVDPGLALELDGRSALERIPETARDVTGARYAALGILNEQRNGLERFLTAGVDAASRRSIGHCPRGRGVLGLLIEDPYPLRLRDVAQHPMRYGFPPGHPAMHSFLGVPVVIGAQVCGNLYLTDKAEGEFTQADEAAALILASWASVAIQRSTRRSRNGSDSHV